MTDPAPLLPTTEELHLLGVPSLASFVDRVVRRTVGGRQDMEGQLIAEWGRAARHLEALAISEAGLADSARLEALPAEMSEWCSRLQAQPRFQAAFASLPIGFAMVELDKLVIYQHHVSLAHSAKFESMLRAAAAGSADADGCHALLAVCLPLEDHIPAVQVSRTGRGKFVVQAEVSDLRAFDAQWIEPAVLEMLRTDGTQAAAGVALPIGFGTSALNVVRLGKRMVLNNGYHRAYALRRAGHTMVPCVVQAISHPEELPFAGGSALVSDYSGLFTEPRPPLFKDFFDPAMTTVLAMPVTRRQLQVTVTVESLRVPG